MPEFVAHKDHLRRNLGTLHSYLTRDSGSEREFALDLIRRGHNFVGGWTRGDYLFGPSRFLGYLRINRIRHKKLSEGGELNGTQTDPAIRSLLGSLIEPERRAEEWAAVEEHFLFFCEKLSINPTRTRRKYWLLDEMRPPQQDKGQGDRRFLEGALSVYPITRYERDLDARQQCLELKGTSCMVCGFNFEATFGARGAGYIHVHHLSPLSRAGGEVKTDPAADLVPVCPNCHCMLHRGDELISPEELKQRMAEVRSRKQA